MGIRSLTPVSRHRFGLSLTEAVLSMFLLAGAGLGLLSLFQSGLRASAVAQKRQVATLLAEQRLAEVRAAFMRIENFETRSGFASNGPVSGFPDYLADVNVQFSRLESPCSGFQATEPRRMSSSCAQVEVTVAHPPYRGGDRVRLVSYVAEPLRVLADTNPVAINPVSGVPYPVPPRDSVNFEASARDNRGRPVEDLFYRWSIASGNSNGSVVPRTGQHTRQGQFRNRVMLPTGEQVVRGTCRVRVVTRCGGVIDHGDSDVLHLEGDVLNVP